MRATKYKSSYGAEGFEVLTKGWIGCSWKSQFLRATCRTVNDGKELSVDIVQHYGSTSREMRGSLVLSNEKAVEFAAKLSPEMFELVARVAGLNPDAGEIGAGMLANLVKQARSIVGRTD
ncbi:MAG: hypothetical protein ACR652_18630 [Methylocystis sp.]|uniref:hypothetical protein n=1 Tax=Methylocystis sp. TaxID=1911079 RepID=UPI003DA63F44